MLKRKFSKGLLIIPIIALIALAACAALTLPHRNAEKADLEQAESVKVMAIAKQPETKLDSEPVISERSKKASFNTSEEKTVKQIEIESIPETESATEATQPEKETYAEEQQTQSETPQIWEAESVTTEEAVYETQETDAHDRELKTEPVTEEVTTVTEPETEPKTEVETEAVAEEEPVTEEYIEEEYEEPVAEYQGWNGSVLNPAAGINYGPSGLETYYNLPMGGVVSIMRSLGYSEEEYPYWIRDDGIKMLGSYVMVAAEFSQHPRGSIVPSSLGTALVCDTGAGGYDWLDIAVTW